MKGIAPPEVIAPKLPKIFEMRTVGNPPELQAVFDMHFDDQIKAISINTMTHFHDDTNMRCFSIPAPDMLIILRRLALVATDTSGKYDNNTRHNARSLRCVILNTLGIVENWK